jgi:hypothetical protein
VATSSDGDLEIVEMGKSDGGPDVVDARALRDECRSSIDRPVPDPARRLIFVASRSEESA